MGRLKHKRTLIKLVQTSLALVTLTGVWVPSISTADPLRAGATTLVSVRPDGSPADGAEPSVSQEGRYVAFLTFDQLTQSDTDSASDVYRRDMLTGQTILVSVDALGVARGRDNISPSISGDGTKVAYLSGWCYDYSPEAFCYGSFAHVRDIPSSSTTVVSDTRDYADAVRLSRDGYWAAVAHSNCDVDGCWQYLAAGNSTSGERKYVAPLCECFEIKIGISGDGRYLAFETDSWLVPSDTDSLIDVYRFDRDADGNGVFDEPGKTAATLVGVIPGGESHTSGAPDISDDGNRIAFFGRSASDGLLTYLAYVRDVKQNTTELASQSSQGVRGAGATYQFARLAIGGSTGNRVVFSSYDSHLSPPDTNPMMDVYLREAASGTTSLVSVLPDGNQDIGEKHGAAISYDGRFVAFGSTRLIDNVNLERRVYLRDLEGSCSLICADPGSPEAIPDPPFDLARMCWETGYVGTQFRTDAPTCHSDSGKVSASPARAAREGMLVVGGWDYVYSQGLGLPASFWVAGVYLSSATRIAPVSQGTITVSADISGEMVGNFERSLTLCLNIIQSDVLLAQDCIANDAYHSEALRPLRSSAPASSGSVYAEVLLQTSKDAGYARIRIDSLEINGG